MNIIVLAAGFATRLHPLTLNQAKPLLDIAGRPALSRLLDRLLEIEGLGEVVVVTNALFFEHFQAWARSWDGPVPPRLLDDGSQSAAERRGALGDLHLAWKTLRHRDREGVLVVAGDNLVGFDLRPFARRFLSSGQPLLLVREIQGPVPPGRYSEVVLGHDGKVASFREKPEDPRSPLSCICLYFFTSEVRLLLEEYLAEGGDPDAPGRFLEWLAPRKPLAAAGIDGPWYDLGNPETLEEARAAFGQRSDGADP